MLDGRAFRSAAKKDVSSLTHFGFERLGRDLHK